MDSISTNSITSSSPAAGKLLLMLIYLVTQSGQFFACYHLNTKYRLMDSACKSFVSGSQQWVDCLDIIENKSKLSLPRTQLRIINVGIKPEASNLSISNLTNLYRGLVNVTAEEHSQLRIIDIKIRR